MASKDVSFAAAKKPPPAKKGRRKNSKGENTRTRVTLADKVQAIKYLDDGKTVDFIAKKFGVSNRTVRHWRLKSEQIRVQLEQNKDRLSSKAFYKSKLWRVQEAVVQFFELNRHAKTGDRLPVTGAVISAIALKAKNSLLNEHENNPFLADDEKKELEACNFTESWARKFANGQGWRSTGLHGETGYVVHEGIKEDLKHLHEKIDQDEPDHVFNMDETGLGNISPGCGCSEGLVEENVRELRERVRGRGDTAQIKLDEETAARLDDIDKKLNVIMQHLNIPKAAEKMVEREGPIIP